MNETYTTRDLSNYKELQAYCKKIQNEMNAWLDATQHSQINLEIQNELHSKGYNWQAYKLKLNGSKQYLNDWIEAVINASYTVGVTSEINWF